MPLMSLFNLAMGIVCFLAGCSRALGMQAYSAIILILTSLFLQLPGAIILTFQFDAGVWGLHLAMLVTQIV